MLLNIMTVRLDLIINMLPLRADASTRGRRRWGGLCVEGAHAGDGGDGGGGGGGTPARKRPPLLFTPSMTLAPQPVAGAPPPIGILVALLHWASSELRSSDAAHAAAASLAPSLPNLPPASLRSLIASLGPALPAAAGGEASGASLRHELLAPAEGASLAELRASADSLLAATMLACAQVRDAPPPLRAQPPRASSRPLVPRPSPRPLTPLPLPTPQRASSLVIVLERTLLLLSHHFSTWFPSATALAAANSSRASHPSHPPSTPATAAGRAHAASASGLTPAQQHELLGATNRPMGGAAAAMADGSGVGCPPLRQLLRSAAELEPSVLGAGEAQMRLVRLLCSRTLSSVGG